LKIKRKKERERERKKERRKEGKKERKKECFERKKKKVFLYSNASTGLIILHKIRYNV